MKDSFILYTKYAQQIHGLSMEQRGILFTAILCHESGENLPEMDDVTAMAYSFIAVDLDENARKYEEKCAVNKANGAKGGRPRKPTETEKTERFSEKRTQAKKPDNDNDSEYDNDLKEKPSKKKFAPPTVEEVRSYCLERKNTVDADVFVDFYTAKGWKVGDQSMKDWKAAVRTWERNRRGRPPDKPAGKFSNFPQRTDQAHRDLVAQIVAQR